MSKILLMQPQAYSKFPGMPMGLVYVGSALEHAEHQVNALDLSATPKSDSDLEEIVNQGNFEIIMPKGFVLQVGDQIILPGLNESNMPSYRSDNSLNCSALNLSSTSSRTDLSCTRENCSGRITSFAIVEKLLNKPYKIGLCLLVWAGAHQVVGLSYISM